MSDVFKLILSLSLSGSVLILALLALRPLFGNRLARAWQYYLWIIVLLRLVLPYTPSLGPVGGIFRESPGRTAQVQNVPSIPVVSSQQGLSAPTAPATSALPVNAGGQTVPAAPSGTTAPASASVDIFETLGIVWLSGAVLIFLIKSAQYGVFTRKILKGARPVTDAGITAVFNGTAAALGFKKSASLRVSAQVASPVLIGLFKPVVLLPESALSAERSGLPYVFRHELTHLKRRDILYKWAAELVLCVHWFNPLSYLMTGRIAEACELSCDEAVAARLDDSERRAYGNALLDAATAQAAGHRHLPLMTLREDKINMKERLRTILKAGKKSRRSLTTAVALALCLILSGVVLGACSAINGTSNSPGPAQTDTPSPTASPSGTDADMANEQAVRALVEAFGKVLKNVSLLGPTDQLQKDMDDNYAQYVTPELLASWKADPSTAPGRLTSSPWPDHIDILDLQKKDENSYFLSGNVVEVTSTEVQSGGTAATRPFSAGVVLTGGHWLIGSWNEIKSTDSIVYSNTDYGFDFTLPSYWQGYTIVTEKWQGTPVDGGQKAAISGPKLLIRSPQWTADVPTFDIPIMVFTATQWDAVQREEYAVSAAPVPPTALGSNGTYIFALPPRYDFWDNPGRADVVAIMSGSPLSPTQNISIKPKDAPASASAPGAGVVYHDTQYGFDFDLPASWKGYTLVMSKWQGYLVDSTANGPDVTGPQLAIRSPKWTSAVPTQDIPIMIFTLDQWKQVEEEKLGVSAAPFPPSELGRNSKYVFALPPRYNYAFPAGYEEVEQILADKPLHPNENYK